MSTRRWLTFSFAIAAVLGCGSSKSDPGSGSQGECRTADDCVGADLCMDCAGFADGTQCKIAAGIEVTSGKGFCLPMTSCRSDSDCCALELSKGRGMKCDGDRLTPLGETLPGWCSVDFKAPTCKGDAGSTTTASSTVGCYGAAVDPETLVSVYYCRELAAGASCVAIGGELATPTVFPNGCPASPLDSCVRDGVEVLLYQKASSALHAELCRSTARPDGGDAGTTTTPTGGCGDGKLAVGETCDDANTVSGDGCSSVCQLQPNYKCPVPGQPCQRRIPCGDGVSSAIEACDDGNQTAGDGCSASCRIETGYRCSGNPSTCVRTVCGDATVEGTEGCDDGNSVSGDGCSKDCQVEPSCTGTTCAKRCGDGIIVGEECDDGNRVANDGCSTDCHLESGWTCRVRPADVSGLDATTCVAVCGDGIVVGDEACDLGFDGDTTMCSTSCQLVY
jgi:cysteine-rich repeat protein